MKVHLELDIKMSKGSKPSESDVAQLMAQDVTKNIVWQKTGSKGGTMKVTVERVLIQPKSDKTYPPLFNSYQITKP